MRNAIVSIKIQRVSDPAYAPGTVATWKSVAATGTALEMAKIDRSKLDKASINSCRSGVFRSVAILYIRMCEGLEKKEKLARTSNTV